jgi:ElaB/YqjD/DUF883 family membrane-anchored ribosome-binding protein
MTTHNHVTHAKHMAVRAENRAHNVLDVAQARIARLRLEAKIRSQALMEKVKDRGGVLLEEAQERGQKAVVDSKEWISENPARAVGIAFVAGVIAHAWFRRGED